MSYRLKKETKEIISKHLGIPFEELIEMDFEEIDKRIEKKIGKKITWPEGSMIDELQIMTMEEVDKKIDSIIKDDDWEL